MRNSVHHQAKYSIFGYSIYSKILSSHYPKSYLSEISCLLALVLFRTQQNILFYEMSFLSFYDNYVPLFPPGVTAISSFIQSSYKIIYIYFAILMTPFGSPSKCARLSETPTLQLRKSSRYILCPPACRACILNWHRDFLLEFTIMN